MTREQLAREIYRLDEKKAPHKITENEYVKRCLRGIGVVKPFLKSELEEMYQARL